MQEPRLATLISRLYAALAAEKLHIQEGAGWRILLRAVVQRKSLVAADERCEAATA
jgi:hypothetical protein